MTTTATGSSLEHALGPDGIFTIRLRDGDIRLRAVEGDTMRVRDVHGSELDAMFAIGLGDGNASLRATKGAGHGGWDGRGGTPDLEVELPRRATVVIEAASADIEADGLLGDQRYRTASGDMKLRAVSGRVAIEAVSGDVDIVATGEAAVTIRTVSGDIALRAATLTSLEAATTSGDLRIAGRLAGPGPFALVTVSGDALLAPAGDVRIEMATLSGDLRSQLGGRAEGGRGRRSLVVGSGGPLVSVRSLSGDLLVVPPTPIETTSPGSSAGAGSAAPPPMPPTATMATPILEADYDDARLRILRSLEAGEIDVAEAGRRLEALDGEPVDPGTDTTRTATPEPTDA